MADDGGREGQCGIKTLNVDLIELINNSILIVTVDVFWPAAKIPGSILRPQTPLSYPSQKKTAQKDVTAETALKSALKKTQ